MNAAKGPDRVDRIVAVVNEMAATHRRMSTMMMQGGMMQMMHMQAGTTTELRTAPVEDGRAKLPPIGSTQSARQKGGG